MFLISMLLRKNINKEPAPVLEHLGNRTIFVYVSFCNQLLFDNIIHLTG